MGLGLFGVRVIVIFLGRPLLVMLIINRTSSNHD